MLDDAERAQRGLIQVFNVLARPADWNPDIRSGPVCFFWVAAPITTTKCRIHHRLSPPLFLLPREVLKIQSHWWTCTATIGQAFSAGRYHYMGCSPRGHPESGHMLLPRIRQTRDYVAVLTNTPAARP